MSIDNNEYPTLSNGPDAIHYSFVKETVEQVHDLLVLWARERLKACGLEDVEVFGRFVGDADTGAHVVIFPYRLGPDPKLMEQSQGQSLIQISRIRPDSHSQPYSNFLPGAWRDFGRALTDALGCLYRLAGMGTQRGGIKGQSHIGHPIPFEHLPKGLRDWAESLSESDSSEWTSTLKTVAPNSGVACFVPPAIWWQPGFTLAILYLFLAQDSGRGIRSPTSRQASVALPALATLASAVQRERTLYSTVDRRPLQPQLESYVEALLMSTKGQGDVHEALASTWGALNEGEELEFALEPVHDLNNQEFALLMQALQQKLQPALNLRIRLRLGAGPEIGPSVRVQPRYEVEFSEEERAARRNRSRREKKPVGFGVPEEAERRAQLESLRSHPLYGDAPMDEDDRDV